MTDYTLTDALALLNENPYYGGDTLILRAGTYTIDTLTIPQSAALRGFTIQAEDGARVIITGTDGYVPGVAVGDGVTIKNIWFGGTKKTTGDGGRTVTGATRATLQGCTFFNYGQCISPNHHNLFLQNRFVNCGFTAFMHDIYISNAVECFDVVREGIHVGGEGYKIHLYHDPEYATIHANFMAGSSVSDLAVQQGHDIISNNILWGDISVSYWNATDCTVSKNIVGQARFAWDVSDVRNTRDGNVFCNGQTPFGTNPQVWDAAAITTNLGYSKAQIDTAVSNLKTKFTQTVAQIYADATIEADFTVLKNVIDAWKVQ